MFMRATCFYDVCLATTKHENITKLEVFELIFEGFWVFSDSSRKGDWLKHQLRSAVATSVIYECWQVILRRFVRFENFYVWTGFG